MYDANYLAHRLRAASLGREAAPFLTHGLTGEVTSYGQFFANAERLATALRRMGVAPGDRVAVQAPKTQIMLELYVACVLSGAVFLPLNPAYTGAELRYFLRDATPAMLVCDPSRIEALTALAAECDVPRIRTIAGDESGTLADARDAEVPGFDPVPRGPNDLAAILYTSGTAARRARC